MVVTEMAPAPGRSAIIEARPFALELIKIRPAARVGKVTCRKSPQDGSAFR